MGNINVGFLEMNTDYLVRKKVIIMPFKTSLDDLIDKHSDNHGLLIRQVLYEFIINFHPYGSDYVILFSDLTGIHDV